jgi:Zn-dependent peptidase ImmA (M78 family)/DNA-binding XRE family transcriptional regulator
MRIGTPGFSGHRLREARESRGLSAISLSDLTDVSAQAIYQYENGHRSPSPETLERIANATNVPLAFFTLPDRIEDPSPIFYRSMSTATKAARNRAKRRFSWLQDIASYLSNFVALPNPDFPLLDLSDDLMMLSNDEIERAAEELRRYWRMGDGPISNMVLLLENQGAVLARDRLGAATLDGLSQIVAEEHRPFVVIGIDKGSPARWRFDAAHELGHIILHSKVRKETFVHPEQFKKMEDQANRFAAAFLLPLASFGDDLFGISLDAFRSLKPRWNVSIAMMIIRARDADLLSEDAERKLWIGMSRRKWRLSEPYDDVTEFEEPRLLRRSFELVLEEGGQTSADVTARICLPPSDIETLSGLPQGYLGNYARVALLRASANTPSSGPAISEGAQVIDMTQRQRKSKKGRSVARVEWSRLSGADIESVLGVMLCRDFPTATRVKPSQGDGGIDVWIPPFEAATVYQIKGYTGNIDAKRLSHIKDSWDTLVKYTEQNAIRLTSWFLVTPENPTKEQLAWLRDLTSEAKFPCVWRGLDYADGLASKYPEVIDYYLQDGKERLSEVVQRFLSIAGLKNPVESPSASAESLEEIHKALNEFDPHFYYDFSVESMGSDEKCPPVLEVPRLVSSVQMRNEDRCITFKIIARFNEATNERPIPGSMTLVAEPGTELEQQIQDWAKFGSPLQDVPARNVRWDLPGGFGDLTASEEAVVNVPPSKPQPGPMSELTMRLLEPDGTVVDTLDFVTEEASAGMSRRAARNVGHDRHSGVLRYELRLSLDDREVNISLNMEDPTGRSPADLLRVLRFVTQVRPDRQIQVSVRNGPSLGSPWPIPEAMVPDEQGRLWIAMCESLATIQEHLMERISVPDMSVLTMADVNAWYQAALLLRGESLPGTWAETQIHLHPNRVPPDQVGVGLFSQPFVVKIGEKTHSLGLLAMQVATIRVDDARPPVDHDDHKDIWVIPDDDDSATLRLASSAPGVFGSP